jgi:hypothetical protein
VWPFIVLVTESITPRPNPTPEIRVQPSMLSLRSSASTVAPEDKAANSARQPAPPAPRRRLWFFAALSVVAGVAGAAAFGRPAPITSDVRSGSPGYKQSPSGHDLHWEKKALTVYLDDSLDKVGPGAREAVMQAFGQWVASDTQLPDLTFDSGHTSATPRQDGKSTVSYGRITAPGHEHDVAITVSYSNDKSGEIVEADIILNSLYPIAVLAPKPTTQIATTNTFDKDHDRDHGHGASNGPGNGEEAMDCRNRYDAQNVTTHEAGHFFGLGEDPVEHQATMFQTIDQCETHKRVLALTDVGAVTTLYAKSADPEEAKAGARACSFGGVPQSGTAFWISSGIFALSLVRRRRAR